MEKLPYLSHYPLALQQQIQNLLEQQKLSDYLLQKYPQKHAINSDALLYPYVMDIKNQHMKKSAPISKIIFDKKIKDGSNSLGTHTYAVRVQGSKLKAKNEIRIATWFQHVPIEFLDMIVVHELAHVREKEHNKAFYQLCQHMLPDYHQLELDTRIYLLHDKLIGALY
ncbi:M48 family metallopeptidase [Catenovulum sp. SM1970]|uniref:M48 family metallopeptidase n=1 Tax=Marinifaba aquimaris TaxID=2741323 RepID=UPI0015736E8E|nr:YgjP-like metallopeptidase domain-containing protein [Marinifaba aquimaris]NTS76667.1 M48 family metallopeptidase [Marinifaba aquimaris]